MVVIKRVKSLENGRVGRWKKINIFQCKKLTVKISGGSTYEKEGDGKKDGNYFDYDPMS